MNRVMAEHNSMDFIEEYSSIDVNEDTSFDSFVSSNDFKETKNDYTFIQEVFDPNKTKVDVEIKNNFLILLFSTTKHEPTEFGNVRILDSSTISLPLPPDVNQEEMKKTYQNGILKIVFPKK
jgi:HSP20 family molecular chaperone IbpA